LKKNKKNEQPVIDFDAYDEEPKSTSVSVEEPGKPSLPVLYSKRSDGKIQEWWVEVEDDKYRMVSGIIDGEHVSSNWTVAKPKNVGNSNETTAQDQAMSEAKSHWQKKKDTKYFESVEEAEKSKQFKPMLALKFEEREKDVVYPVWCQPKLDGMRCDTTFDAMTSRNGKPIVSAPHILKAMAPIFAEDPTYRFDGELYCNKLANDFNEIISHVRKTKPDASDLAASKEVIQYWIYDLPSHPGTFSERIAELERILKKHPHPSIVFVPTFVAANKGVLDGFYEKWLDEGYEGQMVRMDVPYENKRSKFLLKRKEFDEGEYEILGVYEGVGNRAGTCAGMNFKTKEGKPFNAQPKGGMEFYKQLWEEREQLIGKEATIRHFKQLTPDGKPRFGFVVAIRDYE